MLVGPKAYARNVQLNYACALQSALVPASPYRVTVRFFRPHDLMPCQSA